MALQQLSWKKAVYNFKRFVFTALQKANQINMLNNKVLEKWEVF